MIKLKRAEDDHPIHPRQVQGGQMVTSVHTEDGLQEYEQLRDELMEYAKVLTGHEYPPIDSPYLTMAEVGYAYHARARQIEMYIFDLENTGEVKRGDLLYKLRTGLLQSFIEMSRKAYDLGSRRLTQEQVLADQRLS